MKIIIEHRQPADSYGTRPSEYFVCDQADSRAHAIEQLRDAEPDAEIVNVYKIEQPRKTPTIAVFIRGGLVQDVCADMPCRVIVLDFDTDGEGDEAVQHYHPNGGVDVASLSDYAAGQHPTRGELPHVLCAIATADCALAGEKMEQEIHAREAGR